MAAGKRDGAAAQLVCHESDVHYPTTFGMAIVERKPYLRWVLVLSGLFIFMMMLKSGSRGGAYATLIGAFVTTFADSGFRRWFGRLALSTVLIFGLGIAFNIADSASALIQIGSNISLNQNTPAELADLY